ncbi:MAG: hypothetical protein U0074_00890 [Kouleothrix sp.]
MLNRLGTSEFDEQRERLHVTLGGIGDAVLVASLLRERDVPQ